MIRVLIVDDHEFVRAMVARVLADAEGIRVVGEAADGSEVLDAVEATRPDVVLMDVRMPMKSGIDATRDLLARQPAIRVLMLTSSAGLSVSAESKRAGAVGLLVKGCDHAVLVRAVRAVAAGGSAWGDPIIAAGEPDTADPDTADPGAPRPSAARKWRLS